MICVEYVTVNPSAVTLKVGEWYYDASAQVLPEDATNKTVIWCSDRPEIATSNQANGYIMAVSKGTTKIYAKAIDSSQKYGHIEVTVVDTVKVSSVTLNNNVMRIEKGKKKTLIATVLPKNAENKSIEWISSDTSIATVVDGEVYGKASGNAIITAKAKDGSGVEASCKVNVTEGVLVNSIAVDIENTTFDIGETSFARETVSPSNTSNKSVTWSSDNPDVVFVNPTSGMLIANGEGEATIIATAVDGSNTKGYSTVKVNASIPVDSVEVCPKALTMNVGESDKLTAIVCPPGANQNVTWCSSNESVACVNETTGEVCARSVGMATITAMTANDCRTNIPVEVKESVKKFGIEKTIFGAVVNDIIGAQAYRVTLNLTYHITKVDNNKVFISEITAFTKYDKGSIAYGLDYPDISIGELIVGNDNYKMQTDNRDRWSSLDWVDDAKVIYLNKWYDIGTEISVLSILMLDASLFPYREVRLKTQIIL